VKNETLSRSLLYLAIIVVGVIVVWGFLLVGSPSFNRKLSADRNRIDDLQQLSNGVEQYFDQQKKLPDNLIDLEKVRYGYGRERRLEDPTSKKPYDFKVKDPYSYQLCAEFELTSKEAELEKRPYNYYGGSSRTNWDHEIGHHCFLFEIPVAKRNSKAD